jgi:uncharacterized protein YdhG (YjbR/CyaY superfamily)
MAIDKSDRASYFPLIEKKHGQPMSYWFDQMAEIKELKYPEQIAYLRENHGFSQAHANALVLFSRGSKSSRRHDTVEHYLAPYDEATRATVLGIFSAITTKYAKLELVIAWNHPVLRHEGQYIFGVNVLKNYLLISPLSGDVIQHFLPRLAVYEVNKKTIRVPLDWTVDATLVRDMAAARLAEVQA